MCLTYRKLATVTYKSFQVYGRTYNLLHIIIGPFVVFLTINPISFRAQALVISDSSVVELLSVDQSFLTPLEEV